MYFQNCFKRIFPHSSEHIKGKGSCLESRLHDNTCSTDFTFPLAKWAPMQPATVDSTLDLCTRYPLRLGGPRQCGIQSCLTLLHMPSTGNRTPDLLILSPTPYPLGHMLPSVLSCKHYTYMHSLCLNNIEWGINNSTCNKTIHAWQTVIYIYVRY